MPARPGCGLWPFPLAVMAGNAKSEPAGRAQHDITVRFTDHCGAEPLRLSCGPPHIVGVHVKVAACRAIMQSLDTQDSITICWKQCCELGLIPGLARTRRRP